jgi:hypothetical protein
MEGHLSYGVRESKAALKPPQSKRFAAALRKMGSASIWTARVSSTGSQMRVRENLP